MATAPVHVRIEVDGSKYYFTMDVPAGDGSGDVELFRQEITARLSQTQKDQLAYIAAANDPSA